MDVIKKHILLLNTTYKTSGTNDDCIFHLNENELHESHRVMLKDVIIPNTLYNIELKMLPQKSWRKSTEFLRKIRRFCFASSVHDK